jgi:multidrug resistance efflux pump
MSDNQLKASGVAWKRLKKGLVLGTVMVGGGAAVAYGLSGDRFVLTADGLVAQEKVVVASPYDARVRQVLVKPGDHVEAGDKIAVVESATLSRTLAELSAEKARLQARVAQLQARRGVVEKLLPLAEQNTAAASDYLDDMRHAKARGLAVEKTLQDLSTVFVASSERTLTLSAERVSLETEQKGAEEALTEIRGSYANMQSIYEQGVLRAPVAGTIGADVGSVGEVLSPGTSRVAQIHTGEAYVLAYLPDSYLFDVEEGQPVAVTARGRTVSAKIQKVLPVTETLPSEFQNPNRARTRGQMVRIDLEEKVGFAVDQRIEVTSCYVTGCKTGFTDVVRTLGNSVLAWANEALHTSRISEALLRPPHGRPRAFN